jgi:hypothetical protein
MHVAGPGFTPTEGCIALARPHLLRLLRAIAPDTRIEIPAKKNGPECRGTGPSLEHA